MAQITPIERAERVLGFLLAFRIPKMMGLMVLRGFRRADLDEGFLLLRRVAPATVTDAGGQNYLLEEKTSTFSLAGRPASERRACSASTNRAGHIKSNPHGIGTKRSPLLTASLL